MSSLEQFLADNPTGCLPHGLIFAKSVEVPAVNGPDRPFLNDTLNKKEGE